MMLIRSRTLSVKHNHCCAAPMTGSALNRLWNLRTLALDMARDAAITRIRKTPAKDSTSSSSTRTSNGRSGVSVRCSGGRTFRWRHLTHIKDFVRVSSHSLITITFAVTPFIVCDVTGYYLFYGMISFKRSHCSNFQRNLRKL